MAGRKRRTGGKQRFAIRRRGSSSRKRGQLKREDLDGRIVRGRFEVTPDGHGLVISDETPHDVFIPKGRSGEAADRDLVKVRLSVGRKGRLRGDVIARQKPRDSNFVGVLHRERRSWVVEPEPFAPAIRVAEDDLNGAGDRDAVVAEIVGVTPRGDDRIRVIECLGSIDDPRIQLELLVRASNWPLRFEAEVEDEAGQFPEVDPQTELNGKRRDLRHIPHVTIDGMDARDFDDAVSARREGDHARIWVSIADVSHYVRTGRPLDVSARARSTSVYFPGRVLPMLPERLSNDLCSLRPHRPRLTLTCELRVDPDGQVDDVSVYPSLIESMARLSYDEVQAVFDRRESSALEHRELLEQLRASARRLREERTRRGALELDLPESKITLNDAGIPVGIGRRQRLEAHRVIEDLMIAANEAVARFMESNRCPSLYRIHEAPNADRLTAAAAWSSRFGLTLDIDEIDEPQNLAAFVDATRSLPASDVIHMLTLRAMAQARYAPENIGHYGLASRAYLHFTSPIRRYPDLQVHRSLKAFLTGNSSPDDELEGLGVHCSNQEREAMEVERSVVRLMECQVARQFLGSTAEVVVTGVHTAGAFVRAERPLVEGLIPMRRLGRAFGDYMNVDDEGLAIVAARSGRRLVVGERLVARLTNVDLARRHIDFEPVELLREEP